MSDARGLNVTVCHYPPGCSKWNPIEHRLFGPISMNWAGHPLRTFEGMLAALRGTTTTPGLSVAAVRHEGDYPTGQSVSDAAMAALNLDRPGPCPTWNYTVRPRDGSDAPPLPGMAKREVIF
ncbi:MAG: hypothetical protein NVS4B12_29220 [Ktedonobacteraceae bacterium]